MKSLAEKIIKLSEEAGATIMQYHRKGVAVETKSDSSPVTQADKEANTIIVEALKTITPDIPVIAEESKMPTFEERRDWKSFWLVDPLDGTKEFIKGLDEFTVNVALIEDGKPVLGVIYAPAKSQFYFGGKGLGSWKMDSHSERKQIFCSVPTPPFSIVESRSHTSEEQAKFLSMVPIGERVSAGSSLKFCAVAEGKADLYPRFVPSMEWDVGAGDAIYRFAGKQSENDSPLRYNKESLRNGSFVLGRISELRADRPTVVWFTGLSGAGKTTIAEEFTRQLKSLGKPAVHLDGDEIRKQFPQTGFSKEDRTNHILRVGERASELEREGKWVIVSLISPFESARKKVREMCQSFFEVYVSTPLQECEKRDPKGLYKKARSGEIKDFTGIDSPYEVPSSPELAVDSSKIPTEGVVLAILAKLEVMRCQ